jgi:hypothetical protein
MAGELARWGVDTRQMRRIPGRRSSISAILVDARGERLIVNYRGDAVATRRAAAAACRRAAPPLPAVARLERPGARHASSICEQLTLANVKNPLTCASLVLQCDFVRFGVHLCKQPLS